LKTLKRIHNDDWGILLAGSILHKHGENISFMTLSISIGHITCMMTREMTGQENV
jgi:hypothetical protein